MASGERPEPSDPPDRAPPAVVPDRDPPIAGAARPALGPQTMTVVGVGFLRPLGRISGRDDTLGRLARMVADSFVVRCLIRLANISGRDRVLVLAGQAFTAIIPLMILVSALSP